MFKLNQIEQISDKIRNMFIPCAIFAISLLSFYTYQPFSDNICKNLHFAVYFISFAGFIALLYFNRGRTIFLFLIIIMSYTLINFLKHIYADTYLSSPFYISLSTLLPINLILFYFINPRNLLSKSNTWLLLGIFIQFSLAEILARHQIGIGINLSYLPHTLNLLSSLAFLIIIFLTFYNSIHSGSITDYHLFFVSLSQALTFYYSNTASGLCIFTTCSLLCLISAFIQNIYFETYKDPLTGLDSRNSYILHSKNFPIKYCIGIISIDDYDRLGKNFGRRIRNILTKLISRQISELQKSENIYRYNPDEFIIIFNNLNKKESFEQLENIRRSIASSEFQYSSKRKNLKLTISACVAEKKRSDASSFEVLQRADKALQKTRMFSHNVTSQA